MLDLTHITIHTIFSIKTWKLKDVKRLNIHKGWYFVSPLMRLKKMPTEELVSLEVNGE